MLNKNPKRPSTASSNTKRLLLHPSKITKMITPVFIHISRCHKAHKKPQQKGETNNISTVVSDDGYKFNLNDSSPWKNYSSLPTNATLQDGEVLTDTIRQWRCEEDNKQLSSVSVLDEEVSMTSKGHVSSLHFPLKDGQAVSPTWSNSMSRRTEEDSIISALLLELLMSSLGPGISEAREVNSPKFSQHLKTKRVLQQNKQLLYDSIKEAIEIFRRNTQIQEFISMEELRKIICEQICLWGKQSSHQQSSFDVSAAAEEDYFEKLSKQIAMEIEDYITDETIEELVNSCLLRSQ